MIVKAIKHFGDKTTGTNYAEQVKKEVGDIFECSDDLAKERIEKGFVVQATDEEAKKYTDSIDTIDNKDQNNDKIDDEKGNNGSSSLEELAYSDLQDKAKELGLKYVGVSKNNLIKSIKESNWAVTQEDDGNIHVRPVVDGEIVNTPVEQVITNEELKKGDE